MTKWPNNTWAPRLVTTVSLLFLGILCHDCKPSGGCKVGEPNCHCPPGGSCTQDCATGKGCSLFCSNQNQQCTLRGANECFMACQGSRECTTACGADSVVACQGVSGLCRATVGPASRVSCENAALCEVKCSGDCDIDCRGSHCRVKCTDPTRCNVLCDKDRFSRVCPDGATKVCDEPCPP